MITKEDLREKYETETGKKHGNALFSTTDYACWLEKRIVKNYSIQSFRVWRTFDTPPKAGQEILIVWEAFPPEKRILTDEDLAKNWDGMRWLPIPAYL